jgi:TIR domain
MTTSQDKNRWDIFVSYASPDKEFARSLVSELADRGLKVWFDEGEIRIGDSIQRAIEDALENSRFFLIILSPALLERTWAQFEIGVAMGRPDVGKRHILPVYRGLESSELARRMPLLADRVGIDAERYDVKEIAARVFEAVTSQQDDTADDASRRR